MFLGEIVESGTHDELLKQKGLYYQLVVAQTLQEATSDYSSADDEKVKGKQKEDGSASWKNVV